jgi:predicted metalloprotease with PDZ domain
MQNFRRSFPGIIVFVLLLSVQVTIGQKGKLDITYTVALADPATRQFHVTTDIKNIDQDVLELSLPTWTPGWYVVENYYKNVLRFKITDGAGKQLPFRMTRKQTWRVDTSTIKQLRVEYDYAATTLALNQAKVADDMAFFTGIQLFLEPHGHRNTPSTVKYQVPDGWKLATPLKSTADPMTFTAADYDTLVDAPVEMGKFDQTTFDVEGKPHHFIAYPAGGFSAEKTAKYTEMLRKVALEHKEIFGDLPYDKFVYYYFFAPPESNASGALEHLNSFVHFAPAGDRTTPEQLITTGAHEFFHVWNVKRFRPAEMWPYDYSREQETPLLWVSEGFTSYYASLIVYRAGIISEEQWLGRTAGAVSGVEGNEARHYIAPANASVATWVGYDSPVAFSISYYTAGQNLAGLLDISIRNDTNGERGLDDVMRALYGDFYKRGRGFTSDDLLAVINRISGKNYTDFFRKYVYGTEIPDYDTIFGYAGFEVERNKQAAPIFGFNIRNRDGGYLVNSIVPGSSAAKAGLVRGDLITKAGDKAAQDADWNSFAGKTVKLAVVRGSEEREIEMTVDSREYTSYALAPNEAASEIQKRIRAGWLAR